LLSLKIIVMIKVKQGALMIKIVRLVFWKIVLIIFLNEYWSRCMKRLLIYLMSWIIFHIHFTSFQLFIIKFILIVIFQNLFLSLSISFIITIRLELVA
jgi:hypothetical protein